MPAHTHINITRCKVSSYSGNLQIESQPEYFCSLISSNEFGHMFVWVLLIRKGSKCLVHTCMCL